MKYCPWCKQDKPVDDFYNSKRRSDGKKGHCKKCESFKHRERKYGISLEQYMEILVNQNYLCAICKKKAETPEDIQKMHVDHCHKTSKIRGILCNQCNRGIGYLQDDPILTARATEYLKIT